MTVTEIVPEPTRFTRIGAHAPIELIQTPDLNTTVIQTETVPVLARRKQQIRENWGEHGTMKTPNIIFDAQEENIKNAITPEAWMRLREVVVAKLQRNQETSGTDRKTTEIAATALAIWYATRVDTTSAGQLKGDLFHILTDGKESSITRFNQLMTITHLNPDMSRTPSKMNLGEIMAALVIEQMRERYARVEAPLQIRSYLELQFKLAAQINGFSREEFSSVQLSAQKRLVETLSGVFPPETLAVLEDIELGIAHTAGESRVILDLKDLPPQYPQVFLDVDTIPLLPDRMMLPKEVEFRVIHRVHDLKEIDTVVYQKGGLGDKTTVWLPIRRYYVSSQREEDININGKHLTTAGTRVGKRAQLHGVQEIEVLTWSNHPDDYTVTLVTPPNTSQFEANFE